MVRFPIPFRKPKRYILYLARRGRPLVIEEIEARNIDEARDIAETIIDSLNPEELPDLKKYKWFIIEREDKKERKRIRNPFHSEEKEKNIEEAVAEMTLAMVLERLPQMISSGIDFAMKINQTIMQRVVENVLSTVGLKSEKEAMLDRVIQIGKNLIELYKLEKEKGPLEGGVIPAQPQMRPRVVEKQRGEGHA